MAVTAYWGAQMKNLVFLMSAVAFSTPAWAADAPEKQQSNPQSTSVMATGAAASAAAAQDAPMTPQERDQLLQEIRALRDRVTALETRSTQVQYSPEAPEHHKLLGDNNFELYGFVQLDAIQDF